MPASCRSLAAGPGENEVTATVYSIHAFDPSNLAGFAVHTVGFPASGVAANGTAADISYEQQVSLHYLDGFVRVP